MTRCMREGGVAALGRGQPGDQRRLARPEAAVPEAAQRVRRERLPRLVRRTGRAPIADRQEAERDRRASRRPPTPVDSAAPTSGPATSADAPFVAEDQARRAPSDEPADVVQVDEQEREHEPVPERVREPAGLEDLDRARQPRVQAARGTRARDETVPGGFARPVPARPGRHLPEPRLVRVACPRPVFEGLPAVALDRPANVLPRRGASDARAASSLKSVK